MAHKNYYAHLSNNRREPLIDHLIETGMLAEKFASVFGCGKLGLQLGLLHDVGKHTDRFQKVLCHELKKIDHAIVAAECYAELASQDICPNDFIYLMICHCLNAHHSILQGNFRDIGIDGIYQLPKSFDAPAALTSDREKLNAISDFNEYQDILTFIDSNHLLIPLAESDFPNVNEMSNAEKMLFVRMMQSCLVDADYSATASFEDPEYAKMTCDRSIDAEFLLKKLERYHDTLVQHSDPENAMNQLRGLVYLDAADAGCKDTGFFTLTVPTGTAKTLAMMRFALEHAKCNGLQKIFIVLPYLSITTQNTEIYRSVFGDDVVLEDDSMTEYSDEARVYADRWNSPIIVTTSVKFFETLQAAKASDLRRLHQIAHSVVIFDESQTLDSELTDITIKTLQALSKYYHTSIVLSTATQPSYQYRKALQGFQAREIIHDPVKLYRDYAKAKKTTVCFSVSKKWTPEDLASYFADDSQVLCVSNTTNKALRIYLAFEKQFGDTNTLYLSSRMCPAHKSDVIRDIRQRLQSGRACFLSSTQCVEAGVDFDFPSGGREYASLTAISRTAGRINRNGKRAAGKLLVFRSDQSGKYDFPSESYQNEADITYHMALAKTPDTNSLQDIDEFYRRLYSGDSAHGHDKHSIIEAEGKCDVKQMSEDYQLISGQNQCNVIVPYDKCIDEFNELTKKLVNQNYVLNKKELYAHHKITVSIFVSTKSLEYIRKHCHQLCLRAPDQNIPTNWYIADRDEIYSPKTGLKTKEDQEEGGIIYV